MGSCLEVNDQEILVQRVNGPVGGLSMVLDTRTEHYLESTETEGFFVLLRMPNETVLNKEYAFAVSPGKETLVQLQTTEITRLEPRYGTCKNEEDVFKSSARSTTDKKKETKEGINMADTLTVKECFRNQVLWQYMREPLCKCYPWYIYTRHINPPPTRDTELEHHIYQYFTQGMSQEKRIEFDNSTCYYQDQFSYSGTSLKTIPSISSALLCAEQCKQTDNCVLFMWTPTSQQEEEYEEKCVLFDETAILSEDLEYRVQRGTVNCTLQLEECSFTTEAMCQNMVIDSMMHGDESSKPMECKEPCSYNKTSYTLASSNFPSAGLWQSKLSTRYPHYRTLEEAQRNLVKLVFYQEVLIRVKEVQTAAYSFRNFIGELGGTLDLFVGISLMTVFKVVEWLANLGLEKRKGGEEQETGSVKENTEAGRRKEEAQT